MNKFAYLIVVLFLSCQTRKEITFTQNDINIIPKPTKISLSDG